MRQPYGNLHLMIITDFERLFVCTQLCFHRRLPFCLLYLVQKQTTINRRMIYSIIDCLYGTFDHCRLKSKCIACLILSFKSTLYGT